MKSIQQPWYPWLMLVIPATQEAESRRTTIRDQPRQIVHETLSQKHPSQKRALLKVSSVYPASLRPWVPTPVLANKQINLFNVGSCVISIVSCYSRNNNRAKVSRNPRFNWELSNLLLLYDLEILHEEAEWLGLLGWSMAQFGARPFVTRVPQVNLIMTCVAYHMLWILRRKGYFNKDGSKHIWAKFGFLHWCKSFSRLTFVPKDNNKHFWQII
jgi:hypothetical protein